MPNSPSLARRWLNTIGKIAAVVGPEDQGAADLDLAIRPAFLALLDRDPLAG